MVLGLGELAAFAAAPKAAGPWALLLGGPGLQGLGCGIYTEPQTLNL